jgi:hypothetical protein
VLIRRADLEGIRAGTVTLAFRRWRRPSVRSEGTLLTAAGQLRIAAVTPVAAETINEADARRAGYKSLVQLQAELAKREEGAVYRIEFGELSVDPRSALRDSPAVGAELLRLRERLQRLDSQPGVAPWTHATLELLSDHPAVRAADLCVMLGQERDAFKRNVRKLKGLGLTESLERGYRLSARGLALRNSAGRHRA